VAEMLGGTMLNRVYQMDCVEGMKHLIPDDSIDLTVTSPPYDNLRTYNGYSFDFEAVAQQLYRVTKPGGVVVWVVADETKQFCESLTSFKQALYFVEYCGFNLLDTMIYYKKNYAPAYPTLRRYANQFEYMFVFTKGKPKTFNPVQREKSESTSKRYKSSAPMRFAQSDGTYSAKVIGDNGRTTKDASNVWMYGVGQTKNGHPAPFPEQLAQDHILSWSNEGDIVFDPFMGSGTTAKMAQINNRRFIGFEISPEYIEIINKRLESIEEDYVE
jgi:DNA modification methylase